VDERTALILSRDKILRVIGRDPTAGLTQARAWISGSDRQPDAAYAVIKDIGGYEEDLQAAKLAEEKIRQER